MEDTNSPKLESDSPQNIEPSSVQPPTQSPENIAQPIPPPSLSSFSTQPSNIPQPLRPHSHGIFYILLVIFLGVGLAVGYMFFSKQPKSNVQVSSPVATNEIALPADAQKIEECDPGRGAMYIRPEDVPYGPVYLVHQSKVIGMEYMIPKDKIIANESMDFLTNKNVKIDHIAIGPIPNGHAGLSTPHYHVELYTISKEAQKSITCPGGAQMNMEGMDKTTSGAAMPVTTMPSQTPTGMIDKK